MAISRRDIRRIVAECVHAALNEGATRNLYHYITAEYLIKMLRNNKIYPQEAERYVNIGNNSTEYVDGKDRRFISMTRNKNFHSGYPVLAYGEVGTHGEDGIVCRVEFDGEALNMYNNFKTKSRWGEKRGNFKVKPMDWVYKDLGDGRGDPHRIADETGVFAHNGKEWMMGSDDVTYFGWDGFYSDPLTDKRSHPMSQSEDRLTTTSKYIPNADKYIKRVDVYFDERMTDDYSVDPRKKVSTIQRLCRSHGIEFRLYDDLRDFSLQR